MSSIIIIANVLHVITDFIILSYNIVIYNTIEQLHCIKMWLVPRAT